MIKGKYYNPIPFPATSQSQSTAEAENPDLKWDLIENVPGSTIKCEGPPRIERINSPADLLEKLKNDLANNKLSPSAKQNKINRLTGFCSVCRDIPEFFMIYDNGDVQKIETYCSNCLEQEKVREYNELSTN